MAVLCEKMCKKCVKRFVFNCSDMHIMNFIKMYKKLLYQRLNGVLFFLVTSVVIIIFSWDGYEPRCFHTSKYSIIDI